MPRLTRLIILLAALAAALAISFSYAQAQTYSLFAASPTNNGGNDTNSVELGVRFSSDTAGTIGSIRFYKRGSLSSHTVSLWTASGGLLARATDVTETASGWQQADFDTPVAISANVSYVASYHTVGYIATQHFFDAVYNAAPLHAPVSAGLYAYSGSPILPNLSYMGSNYWVDVLFIPQASGTPTPTPTPTAIPTATNTPAPTDTPTVGPSATPTATVAASATPSLTPTPAATAIVSGGYVCTEFVGFSVTDSWYPSFIASVPNPGQYQLRWWSGGSIDQWAQGSAFSGWTDPANLVTHCAANSGSPDRIILNVSGEYNTNPASWASMTQQTIDYIRATYSPAVMQIVLQPPVGGPSSSMCPTSDPLAAHPWVRATYNWPFVEAGFQQILSATVVQGAYTQVASCADYADWAGHLVPAAQSRIGMLIANAYTQTR